jgi:hypothetical protein
MHQKFNFLFNIRYLWWWKQSDAKGSPSQILVIQGKYWENTASKALLDVGAHADVPKLEA